MSVTEVTIETVDANYIRERMEKIGLTIDQISIDTGIPEVDIVAIISGNVEINQLIKSLFFYYFIAKK